MTTTAATTWTNHKPQPQHNTKARYKTVWTFQEISKIQGLCFLHNLIHKEPRILLRDSYYFTIKRKFANLGFALWFAPKWTDYHTVCNASSDLCSLITKLKQDIRTSRAPCLINIGGKVFLQGTSHSLTGNPRFSYILFQFRNQTTSRSQSCCVIVGSIFDANQWDN